MKPRGLSVITVLMTLTLCGCYAQYNDRPPGWEPGWHRGHHHGHSGWYDARNRWQGWRENGVWHDEWIPVPPHP